MAICGDPMYVSPTRGCCPQAHQQFEQAVNLNLCAQIVAGVRALSSANPNWNRIAAKREGILVVVIVSDVEDPVALQAVSFSAKGVPLVSRHACHDVYHLLAAEDLGIS
jgi:hypothetical protein